MSDENLSSRSRLAFGITGAAVLLGAAGLAVIGTTQTHSGATYYNATFGRAGQGLDSRSDVKIRGIAVGGIHSVKLNKDGRVTVRFRVNKGLRLPTGATATIEPVSVFGPKDLTLDLGAGEGKGPYLSDGGTIDKTKDPEELADTAWPTYRLTSALNPQEIASILHTFSQALYGQGPALRRTVDNSAKLIDLTYGNRREIQQLIADVGALSGTFGDRGGTITQTAADFNTLSPAINDRPDKVSQLLTEAGGVASRVGDTLRRHGDDIAEVVDGAGDATQVLYQGRSQIPVLIDGLNSIFNLLSDIIRVPGPEGTRLAQAVNYLPVDICKIFADVCTSPGTGSGRNLMINPIVKSPQGGRR